MPRALCSYSVVKTTAKFTPQGNGSVFVSTGLDGPAFIALASGPRAPLLAIRVASFDLMIRMPGGIGPTDDNRLHGT